MTNSNYAIGAVGHRPPRMIDADEASLWEMLTDAFASACPVDGTCRVINSIAEGADQLMANAAIDQGYSLTLVLPFGEMEYAKDFEDGEVLDEFQRLLKIAETVITLPGNRQSQSSKEAAYSAAGAELVDLSDALIAVWDGALPAGPGGTAEQVEVALRKGIPVLWIDASTPHVATLLGNHQLAPEGWQRMAASVLGS